MKLITKILGIVTLAAALAVTTATQVSRHEVHDQGERNLADKSRAILDQLEGTRDYVTSQGGLLEYIESIRNQYPDGNIPKDIKQNILRRVPILPPSKWVRSRPNAVAISFGCSRLNPAVTQIWPVPRNWKSTTVS